jgi:hypothetical protein
VSVRATKTYFDNIQYILVVSTEVMSEKNILNVQVILLLPLQSQLTQFTSTCTIYRTQCSSSLTFAQHNASYLLNLQPCSILLFGGPLWLAMLCNWSSECVEDGLSASTAAAEHGHAPPLRASVASSGGCAQLRPFCNCPHYHDQPLASPPHPAPAQRHGTSDFPRSPSVASVAMPRAAPAMPRAHLRALQPAAAGK